MFLGEDLLAWLVLAFGGAMAVGNVLALIRPPTPTATNDPIKPPVVRTVTFALVGLVVAIWAVGTLAG